jgi:hypothetical protein
MDALPEPDDEDGDETVVTSAPTRHRGRLVVGAVVTVIAAIALVHPSPRSPAAASPAVAPADCGLLSDTGWISGLFRDIPTSQGTAFGLADCHQLRLPSCPAVAAATRT